MTAVEFPLIPLFVIVLVLAWICSMLWVFCYIRLSRLLEKHHPRVYEQLGGPPVVLSGAQSPDRIISMWALIRYISGRQYTRTHDHAFIAFADRSRRVLYSCLILDLAVVLLLPFFVNS